MVQLNVLQASDGFNKNLLKKKKKNKQASKASTCTSGLTSRDVASQIHPLVVCHTSPLFPGPHPSGRRVSTNLEVLLFSTSPCRIRRSQFQRLLVRRAVFHCSNLRFSILSPALGLADQPDGNATFLTSRACTTAGNLTFPLLWVGGVSGGANITWLVVRGFGDGASCLVQSMGATVIRRAVWRPTRIPNFRA